MAESSAPRDRDGRRLKVGDVVRVIGVPELRGVSEASRRDCLPVFRHLVGTYRTINAFDELGFAELSFRIRSGKHRGMHWVTLEPYLLKRREGRHAGNSAGRTSRKRAGARDA